MQARKGSTSFVTVVREIYKGGGVRNFYRGIAPCLVRAVPANAVTFFGYEKTVELFGAE